MKQKNLLICLTLLICIASCTLNDTFYYQLKSKIQINKNEIITLTNDGLSYIKEHLAIYNFEATCFYDEHLGLGGADDETYYEYIEKKLTETTQTALAFEFFYVGYFKTIEEAIYFAETNLDNLNKYIFSNTDNLSAITGIDYDYRIDQICNTEKEGYVVSFGSLDTYISQKNIYLIKNKTFHDSLESAINNDEILNNLQVFFVYDIYLGLVNYMGFEISQ